MEARDGEATAGASGPESAPIERPSIETPEPWVAVRYMELPVRVAIDRGTTTWQGWLEDLARQGGVFQVLEEGSYGVVSEGREATEIVPRPRTALAVPALWIAEDRVRAQAVLGEAVTGGPDWSEWLTNIPNVWLWARRSGVGWSPGPTEVPQTAFDRIAGILRDVPRPSMPRMAWREAVPGTIVEMPTPPRISEALCACQIQPSFTPVPGVFVQRQGESSEDDPDGEIEATEDSPIESIEPCYTCNRFREYDHAENAWEVVGLSLPVWNITRREEAAAEDAEEEEEEEEEDVDGGEGYSSVPLNAWEPEAIPMRLRESPPPLTSGPPPIVTLDQVNMEAQVAVERAVTAWARQMGVTRVHVSNDHGTAPYGQDREPDRLPDQDPAAFEIVCWGVPERISEEMRTTVDIRGHWRENRAGETPQRPVYGVFLAGAGQVDGWDISPELLTRLYPGARWDAMQRRDGSQAVIFMQIGRVVYIPFDLPHVPIGAAQMRTGELLSSILARVDAGALPVSRGGAGGQREGTPMGVNAETDPTRVRRFETTWQVWFRRQEDAASGRLITERDSALGYERALADRRSRIAREEATIAAAREGITRVAARAASELAFIMALPGVESVRVIESDAVDVYLAPIEIPWSGRVRLLGRLRVRVDCRNRRIRVFRVGELEGFTGRAVHPHVSTDGNPCWGNLLPQVEEWLMHGDIGALVGATIQFLGAYAGAGYYTPLDAWPVKPGSETPGPAATVGVTMGTSTVGAATVGTSTATGASAAPEPMESEPTDAEILEEAMGYREMNGCTCLSCMNDARRRIIARRTASVMGQGDAAPIV